jgi:DNA polymerase
MMKSVIDFETRSPVDIKTCGAYAYAAHPDTEVMMLAVRICGQEARVWVAPAYRHFLDTELSDDELQDIIDNCEEIAAHNAPFERAIWKFKMEPLWFKPLPLEKIRCTMSQALMCNLPRKLEQAVKVWRKDAPQKDNEGHKLMMKMSKPRKFRKAELSAFPDPEKAKATQEYVYAVLSKGGIPTIKNYHQYIVYPCDEPMFKRYVEYCRQDVVAEEVLFTELPPIPERELKVWRLDQTINDRGVGIDRFHAVKIMDMVNKVEDILTEEASEITYGAVSTMKSSKAIIEWLQSRGVDTDSASKQAISDLLERPDLPSDVRRFLEIRQTIAMSSTAKYQTMLCTSCYDGRAHGTMIYHGASTGRFCLSEGSMVKVCDDAGCVYEKPIETVDRSEKVWDGSDWVHHDGVIFSGDKPVIEWDGIIATEGHKVFISDTEKMTLSEAKERELKLWQGEKP